MSGLLRPFSRLSRNYNPCRVHSMRSPRRDKCLFPTPVFGLLSEHVYMYPSGHMVTFPRRRWSVLTRSPVTNHERERLSCMPSVSAQEEHRHCSLFGVASSYFGNIYASCTGIPMHASKQGGVGDGRGRAGAGTSYCPVHRALHPIHDTPKYVSPVHKRCMSHRRSPSPAPSVVVILAPLSRTDVDGTTRKKTCAESVGPSTEGEKDKEREHGSSLSSQTLIIDPPALHLAVSCDVSPLDRRPASQHPYPGPLSHRRPMLGIQLQQCQENKRVRSCF